MVLSGVLIWVADSAGWLVPVLLGAVALCLGGLSTVSRAAAWTGSVVLVGAAGAVLAVRFTASPVGAIKLCVWSCALLSLISAAAGAWVQGRAHRQTIQRSDFSEKARSAGLVFGTAAFTMLLIVLGMRIVYVAVNLITVFPVRGTRDFGFDADGIWSLGCLFGASGVAAVSTRDRRLYTCQFLIAVVIVTWSCLLWPVFRMTSPGGLQGAGANLALSAGLALLLAVAVIVNLWTERHRGIALSGGRATDYGRGESTEAPLPWPGFRVSFGAVALVVLLLTCYQLAVPVGVAGGSFGVCALVALVSTSVATWACFSLLSRSWSPNLADVTVGLFCWSLCCLAVSVVPVYPEPLAERYPVILNAMIAGLALAIASCTWLATFPRWRSQEDKTRTASAALIPHARRGACLSAVLAVTLGGLMALWPRLPSIAVPDDSMGRVTAGFGGNLLLLLAVLFSARRLESLALHILTFLAMASAAGFMLMRMLPYSPQFG